MDETDEMKVIAATLPKGGVGKTTVTALLGYELQQYGKTLLIDGDQQGNLTIQFMEKETFLKYDKTFLSVLKEEKTLADGVVELRPESEKSKGLYLLGTKPNDEKLKLYLDSEFISNRMVIKMLLREAKELGFKYVLFDLPPNYDFYTKEIYAYCQEIIPVVQLEEFAMEGFKDFGKNIQVHRKQYDGNYTVDNLVCNMVDLKKQAHQLWFEKAQRLTGFKMFILNNSADVKTSAIMHNVLQETFPKNKLISVIHELAEKIK